MKIALLSVFFFGLFTLKLTALESDSFPNSPIPHALSQARIETGYSAGQFIGIKQGYAEASLFLPTLAQDSLIPIIDLRGYRFNDTKWGLSFGGGIRKYIDCVQAVGANVYYDYLEGKCSKSFNRIGLGFEWLGNSVDFRLNAYLPIGNQMQSSKPVNFSDYIGGYQASCRKKQFSIGRGVDAEVGGRLCYLDNFNVYGAIGPYYYSTRTKSHFFGCQASIQASYRSFISIECKASYDSVNQSQVQGRIQVSIPFDILSEGWTCMYEDTIFQPVRRTGVIFTDECCDYKWNW